MVVVRFAIDPAALAAFDDGAVRVVMRDINEEFRLAGAATIGLVAAAFAQRFAGGVAFNWRVPDGIGINNKHVELRHRLLPA
jgi:hypothetical protein